MSLTHYCTGNPYWVTAEDEHGADVSVPCYARTLDEALAAIRNDPNGDQPEDVQCLKHGAGVTLIVVYLDVDQAPSLLLFTEDAA